MVWAREQQAEVEVETCSSGAQRRQPPPEGGDSGRDDGIARPGHGRPNQSRSEDRATGHDDEIVGRHEETLEERESAEAAAAPTMAPGTSSREGNRLVPGEGRYPTRARAGNTATTTAPPKGGRSGRNDGIARPSERRLNKSRSGTEQPDTTLRSYSETKILQTRHSE